MGAWGGPLDSLAKNGTGVIPARAATARNYRVMLNALQKQAQLPTEDVNRMMDLSTDSNKHLAITPKNLYRNIVPDVTGMGVKDAVYMLETNGLQVTVKGKGKVKEQSITPGTEIVKGQAIILQLS